MSIEIDLEIGACYQVKGATIKECYTIKAITDEWIIAYNESTEKEQTVVLEFAKDNWEFWGSEHKTKEVELFEVFMSSLDATTLCDSEGRIPCFKNRKFGESVGDFVELGRVYSVDLDSWEFSFVRDDNNALSSLFKQDNRDRPPMTTFPQDIPCYPLYRDYINPFEITCQGGSNGTN